MTRAIRVVVALVLAFSLAGCAGSAEPKSKALPDLTVKGFRDDPALDLGKVKGPMIINFWQYVCPPCRDEMPLIEDFHQQYGDQVQVVGVDYMDFQESLAGELADSSGVTYPLVADPGGDLNGAGGIPAIRALPFWLVIDENGDVVHSEASEMKSVDDITAMVEDNLGLTL